MNDVPDHTDQRELLKRFIEEGRPATLEAIAEVVEGSGGSYYFRKTYRDNGSVGARRVRLGSDSGLPARLEQMMREAGRSNNPVSLNRNYPASGEYHSFCWFRRLRALLFLTGIAIAAYWLSARRYAREPIEQRLVSGLTASGLNSCRRSLGGRLLGSVRRLGLHFLDPLAQVVG